MLIRNYRKEIRNKHFNGDLFPTRDAIGDALYEEEDVMNRIFLQQMLIDLEES